MTCLKQDIKAVKLTSVMHAFPDALHVTIVVLAVPNDVEHYSTISGPFPSLFLA